MMERPTKEQVDDAMEAVQFDCSKETYRLGARRLAREVRALRELVSDQAAKLREFRDIINEATEICERAEGVEEDLFTGEVLVVLRGAK